MVRARWELDGIGCFFEIWLEIQYFEYARSSSQSWLHNTINPADVLDRRVEQKQRDYKGCERTERHLMMNDLITSYPDHGSNAACADNGKNRRKQCFCS